MTFTLKIDTGNAAFFNEDGELEGHEVCRILDGVRARIEAHGLPEGGPFTLRDINGNIVGKAKLSK